MKKNESGKLRKKWSNIIDAGGKIENDKVAEATAMLLENTLNASKNGDYKGCSIDDKCPRRKDPDFTKFHEFMENEYNKFFHPEIKIQNIND